MNEVLRAALQESGHTFESIAERIGVDPKTPARWLRDDRVPQPRHRAAAARLLGRDIADIWPDKPRRQEPIWFRPWQEIEAEAVLLRSYEPLVFPGLLQTEAYARAVLTRGGLLPPQDIARHVATRMARQTILTREKNPPRFTAVVDESVLRRPVGGPATMREQLTALVTAAEADHVRIQVVPSTVGAYAGLNGPFVLATAVDHQMACYLDNPLKGTVVTDTDEMAAILNAWENVRAEALSHWQSVDLISEVAQTWT
ncbi:helix-turn-helix domain-containing protein [Micromonospora sp. SH-82]|uniref:helix-turn-helix domain-containing protein n=1 Tax=Micromonospora sp. SH-82 TaxID=3132938 RepID=UPI003EB812E2